MPSLRIVALVVLLRLAQLAAVVWSASAGQPWWVTVPLLLLFALGKPVVRFPVLPPEPKAKP
jgi:hypothetical protein